MTSWCHHTIWPQEASRLSPSMLLAMVSRTKCIVWRDGKWICFEFDQTMLEELFPKMPLHSNKLRFFYTWINKNFCDSTLNLLPLARLIFEGSKPGFSANPLTQVIQKPLILIIPHHIKQENACSICRIARRRNCAMH